ncbi:MAG: hypothetical protein HKN84_16305 [Gammaproteobacteria bacterium]|nr:hypothetical protein [Gammaproteobacteria bacterium]
MRILITNGHRNTGLWITRHLGAAGHRVIATDSRALAFGLKSRYAETFELLPEPSAPAYGDRLLAVVRRLRPDVLIPVGGITAISARSEEFERETAILVPDGQAFEATIDKARVYDLCSCLGIPHPRVLGQDSMAVRQNLPAPTNGLPLAVIKPRRDYGAGQGLVFLRDSEHLDETWLSHSQQFGSLVGSEFVPGPVDAQYSVQLLFDRNTELTEFFVLRKLRQWPPGSGITVEATSSHEFDLVEQMLPLFERLRWRGPVEVELKRHAESGDACVIEINPRFSGTVAFPLAAGVDLAGTMLNNSLGRSAPRALQAYYPAGLHYWNPLPYARSVLFDLFRARRLGPGLRGLMMPLTRRPAGNPYVLDDPSALLGKFVWQINDSLRGGRSVPERRG